jgi:xylan 1,4-beta-xylosidase
MLLKKYVFSVLLAALAFNVKVQQANDGQAVNISIDLNQTVGPMTPFWSWFGYDEPNYTYMKDGKKLLSELSALSPVPVYVRTHNLLTSGDGVPALKWGSTNIYTEDKDGKPVYDFAIVDRIFDTYVERGMKPLAQIGFMPQPLSTHPTPYQHHWKPGVDYKEIETGWAYPPKDYKKWDDLVYNWVKHCVARYGAKEVSSWYWEVWNEPNGAYWKGTQAEFNKLYDYAADGVKRALPTARIGGANITGGGGKFLNSFLKHVLKDTNYVTGKIGSPLDAVLFHAKGSPKVVNSTVVMNMSNQLRNIREGFKLVAGYRELKNIPIIIGENDPEGCAACGMATNPENAYRNGTLYASYTAASYARIYQLMDEYHQNLVGAVTWAFEFEDQPWFAGFRDLATNGVDKPVLNVFRMYGMMKGDRVAVTSSRMRQLNTVVDSSIRGQLTDVGALATKSDKSAAIMLWNYHDEDKLEPSATVNININGIPGKTFVIKQYCIDQQHSNSYTAWKKMGSPLNPTPQQVKQLQTAGELQMIANTPILKFKNGQLTTKVILQRQGINLLVLSWQ